MKHSIYAFSRHGFFLVALALCLTLSAITFVGCSAHRQAQKVAPDAATIDRSWAKAGIMSFSDSQHIRQLHEKVLRGGTLDDSDIDWLIAVLHKPSTAPTDSHTTVMATLAMGRPTPAQRQKIRSAVTPLLTREYPDDTRYHLAHDIARQLIKHLDRLDQLDRTNAR